MQEWSFYLWKKGESCWLEVLYIEYIIKKEQRFSKKIKKSPPEPIITNFLH